MNFVWTWKICKKRNYPGWLSLTPLLIIIPILFVMPVINIFINLTPLIILSLIAWYDRK
jgi:hypothetical protein